MKKLILVSFIFFFQNGIACLGPLSSFCYMQFSRPNDLIVKGTIVSSGSSSIQLKVIEVLRGVETRSTIPIWDGTDFECSGNISMKASGIGVPGDTILAVLPKILSVQNTWDVIGDYVRPMWLFEHTVLKIRNDSLIGFVAGSVWGIGIWKMSYNDFKATWTQNNSECSFAVGISESQSSDESIIGRDGFTYHVFLPSGITQTVSISSLQGVILSHCEVLNDLDLNLELYPPGMYLLHISNNEGKQYKRKIVR